MFASKIRKPVVIDDTTVIIRKLSGRSLEKAVQARQMDVASMSKSYGAELVVAFQERNEKARVEGQAETAADKQARRKALYSTYDRMSVLTAGIESIAPLPVKENGVLMTLPEAVADLDDKSAGSLHSEILDLSIEEEDAEAPKGV